MVKQKKTDKLRETDKTSYQCPICKTKLSSSDHLKRHMNIHDKARDKECPLCDYKSARKDTMKRHLRTKHQIKNSPPAPAQTTTEPPLSNHWNQPEAKRVKLVTQETQTDKDDGRQADRSDETPDESVPMEETNTPPLEPIPEVDEEQTVDQEAPEPEGVDIEDEWLVEDNFTFEKLKSYPSRKWNTINCNYEVKIKPLPNEGWQDKLTQIFEAVLTKILKKAKTGTMARLVLFIDGVPYTINDKVVDVEHLNAERILDRVAAALNSNEEANLGAGFKINVIFAEKPVGGTGARRAEAAANYHKRHLTDDEEYEYQRKSILDPAKHAHDNMCMARCLVVGMAMVNHDTVKAVNGSPVAFKSLFDSRWPMQKKRAEQLHLDARVPIGQLCGLEHLAMFQHHLEDYQIVLFDVDGTILFQGPTYKEHQIYLRHRPDHYTLINPALIAGYLLMDHFCKHCLKGYNKDKHQCAKATCKFCGNAACQNTNQEPEERICDDCNRSFKSAGCVALHLTKDCQQLAKCPNCDKTVKRTELDLPTFKPDVKVAQHGSKHNCLQNRCHFCNEHFMPGHHTHCYVQKPEAKKKKKDQAVDELADEGIFDLLGEREFEEGYEDDDLNEDGTCRETAAKEKPEKKLIYADFETENRDSYHDPILLCTEDEKGQQQHAYKGPDCTKNFVDDLFVNPARKKRKRQTEEEQEELRQKNKGFYDAKFVFHNLAGYDSYLLLNEVHKRNLRPKVIYRGSKVLNVELKQNKQSFIDSFLHIPMKLAKMPQAFGFPEMAKQHFPYKLATPENRHYKGPFPPLEMFDPDNMKAKERGELIEWWTETKAYYDAHPEIEYDLQKVNLAYCKNDVSMHKKGVEIYVQRMKELFNGLNPMDHITLPAYCNYVYRKLMMEENSIAVIPPNGYGKGKYSPEAVAWLEWQAYKQGLDVKHALNCNEVRIGKYLVDGFAFRPNGQPVVFEYHGCYVHGHDCILDRSKTCQGMTMDEKQEYTVEKERFLRSCGYEVIAEYACAVDDQKSEDPLMMDFLDTVKRNATKLNPRDALHGGRTNAIRRRYRPKTGEEILYFDINSLYPAVNSSTNGEMWPVGQPKILLHDFPELKDIFGLVKCTVKPPDRLYHPVLGVAASDGRYVFGLCGKCIEQMNKGHCEHEGKDRYIKDIFVSEELKLAVEKGYEIVNIEQVWHWPEDQRSSSLFKEYIATAYREKVEASGWLPEVATLIAEKGKDHPDTQRAIEDYVQYWADEGIQIRPERVEKNKARRNFAKLVLNNFWGFWAKNNNPTQASYLDKVEDFYNKLVTKDVANFYEINDKIMVVHWREMEGHEKADGKSNVVLGAFTTAYARIRLYGYLDIAQERCLYMDTDSVIWVKRPGEPEIPTGDRLGEMKDEILEEYGPKATIGYYGGGGCKTYTLVIVDKETGDVIDRKRKLKGICPTFAVDQVLTQETLERVIESDEKVYVPQRTLRRYKQQMTMKWQESQKVIRSTFTKRIPPQNLEDETDPIGSRKMTE